ncbi:hypothetical protein [Nonomuraea sp. NPDC048916]|uniref:hypothetical protein n=1 Tax=Nonomuraea sp. NPDC048916 TaxID=3154232 RepID=UPI0033E15C89
MFDPAQAALRTHQRGAGAMRRAAALLALALAAGCAGTATETAPSPTAQGVEQRRQAEMATCMKGKGFKYIAFVAKGKTPSQERQAASNGDYGAMKSFRAKYGFGHFATYIYPKEFESPMVKPDNPEINPNAQFKSALSEQQRKAYEKAYDSCYTAAIQKITGKVVKSEMDHYEQVEEARTQAKSRTLDGEPGLVEKATSMADCLRGEGYRTVSANPTAMATRGYDEARAMVVNLGKSDDIDDSKLGEGQFFEPMLTAAQARPYLTKEIKIALDDLECGKDFYAAYLPKAQEIEAKVNEEYGVRT